MAQLADDCFAFSGPLLPVEEVEFSNGRHLWMIPGPANRAEEPARTLGSMRV